MDESEPAMAQRVRKSMRELVREAFATAVAVVAPLLVTAIALRYVLDHLSLVARAVVVAGDRKPGTAGGPPAHRSTERGRLG